MSDFAQAARQSTRALRELFPRTPLQRNDYLSRRFVDQKWSVKTALRELLLTDAFQRSSLPSSSAQTKDANNDLLSHVRVRRLEGEALRDSLITLAGRMEDRMYGPGDNAMGPPHQQVRRSVYLNIRRNSLSPLITTFDGPKPFTTVGRRDATNVPAQSLTPGKACRR